MDLDSRIRQRFQLGLLSPGEYELCETGQLSWSRSLQFVQQELAADHSHPGTAMGREAVSGPKGAQGNTEDEGCTAVGFLFSRTLESQKLQPSAQRWENGVESIAQDFSPVSLTLILNMSLLPPPLHSTVMDLVYLVSALKAGQERTVIFCPSIGTSQFCEI